MLVRVKANIKAFGWYGKQRRRPGDVFEIRGEHELGKWMEIVAVESKDDAVEVPRQKRAYRRKEKGGEQSPL